MVFIIFFFTGTSGQTEESSEERKLSVPSKDLIPATLITKEQLEKQAKPRDKDRRRSTLEESDVQTKDLNDVVAEVQTPQKKDKNKEKKK